MPTNPDYEYSNAMKVYLEASTDEDKLKALKTMLSKAPNHKSSQTLRADIKNKIAKLRGKLERTKKQAKKGQHISIKKEGVATIVLVGSTNTGKSTVLKQLTGAKVEIAHYQYTTKKPEVGIMDYEGLKIQVIEIPSLFENFSESEKGPTYLSLIKQADAMILFFNNPDEKKMIDKELIKTEVQIPTLIYNHQDNLKTEIWKRLNLIKVQTKLPGKKPDYPPIALEKGSTVRDLASHVHKDFFKKFKFARVWGSTKFQGAQVGLTRVLQDNDVVELHAK